MEDYEYHELCELFPIHEDELEEIGRDIKKNGQHEPIIFYQGKIIDGRQRLLACIRHNIKPVFIILNTKIELVDYVISKNLKRRHLTPAEKIEIGIKLEEYKKKQKEQKPILKLNEKEKILLDHKENKRIAKLIGSKDSVVRQVKEILKVAKTRPEIDKAWTAAKRGDKSIHAVHDLLKHPKKTTKPIKKKNIELLRAELKEKNSEILFLKQKLKIIIENLQEKGIWNDIKREIFPIAEIDNSPYPTIKELRKSELI